MPTTTRNSKRKTGTAPSVAKPSEKLTATKATEPTDSDDDIQLEKIIPPSKKPRGRPPKIRTDKTTNDDDTVHADNVNLNASVIRKRVTIALHMPPNSDPKETSRGLLRSFFTQSKRSDRNFAILPWFDDSEATPITSTTQFPQRFEDWQDYFFKFNPKIEQIQYIV